MILSSRSYACNNLTARMRLQSTNTCSLLIALTAFIILGTFPQVQAASEQEDLRENDMRIFTEQDIARYDGSDPNKPLYMAIKGIVFDVTTGKDFYGKGKSYNALVGKDATRAVALWSLEEKDLIPDVTGLTDKQLEGLNEIVESVYKAKYPVIGHMDFHYNPISDEL